MIYVPELNNYSCYVVRSENVIRAYKTNPTYNSQVEYRDYYYNSHYYFNDGYQSFSNYSTLPVCLSNDVLTDNVAYRTDIFEIFFLFLGIIAFVWFFISKLVKTFFRGHKFVWKSML